MSVFVHETWIGFEEITTNHQMAAIYIENGCSMMCLQHKRMVKTKTKRNITLRYKTKHCGVYLQDKRRLDHLLQMLHTTSLELSLSRSFDWSL